jgi:transposase
MARPPIKPVEVWIKEAARRERVSETSIPAWRDQFLDGGRAALAAGARHGPSAHKAELQAQIKELTSFRLGEAHVELRVWRKGGAASPRLGGPPGDLYPGRPERGPLLCPAGPAQGQLVRWRAAVGADRPRPGKGPWPAPIMDQIEPLAAKHAEQGAAWGHRKVWGCWPPTASRSASPRCDGPWPAGACGSQSATRPSAVSSLRPAGRCSWTRRPDATGCGRPTSRSWKA